MVEKGLSQQRDLVTVLEQWLGSRVQFSSQDFGGRALELCSVLEQRPSQGGILTPDVSSTQASATHPAPTQKLSCLQRHNAKKAVKLLAFQVCLLLYWKQRNSFNLRVRYCVGHKTLSNQVCIYSKPFDKGDVLLTLILNMMKCLSVQFSELQTLFALISLTDLISHLQLN